VPTVTGPFPPAGVEPGPLTDLRANVLGSKLRLPSRTKCPPGGHAARAAIEAGETWVVDVDLERFFDRVQHDALMARVARRVGDRRVLRLIRRYLDAGVMVGGVKIARTEAPRKDRPLAASGEHHARRPGPRTGTARPYVRPLCRRPPVYVASERAAQRVLDGITVFVERRLHLRVNQAKSGTAPATVRGLLGFGFYRSHGRLAIRLGPKTKARLRARLREITDRHRSIAMPDRVSLLNRFLAGWTAYFALAETPSVFNEFDEWLRRRLRQVRWKEWKRCPTRRQNLRALGIPDHKARQWASSRKGYWRISGSPALQWAMPTAYWTQLGLVPIGERVRRLRSTGEPPDADPLVRWCGRGGVTPPPTRLSRSAVSGRRAPGRGLRSETAS